MTLIKDLLDRPSALPVASTYTVVNGLVYLASGLLLTLWPGVVQALFLDPEFAGHEASLMRVIGLTLTIVGWFYVFGGRTGGRQFVAATVVDRLLLVPAVLVPLVIAGVFPHTLGTFAILDPVLGLGAWVILGRQARARAATSAS